MTKKVLLDRLRQHQKLRILVRSHRNVPFSADIQREFDRPERQAFYSLMLVVKGEMRHMVDLQEVRQGEGQLMLCTPWQIHSMRRDTQAERYGVSFGEEFLEYFSTSFPFLVDPLENQLFDVPEATIERMVPVFQCLENVLQDDGANPELVLVYLNALLTECNDAYFKGRETPGDSTGSLSVFIRFKNYIENNYLEHPSVEQMAADLGLNVNVLYHLVKSRTGVSPKNYLTERLMLEAKRKLYFNDISIKELAYDLDYNDPEYFARLFRKHTGQSISEYRAFIQDLSGS